MGRKGGGVSFSRVVREEVASLPEALRALFVQPAGLHRQRPRLPFDGNHRLSETGLGDTLSVHTTIKQESVKMGVLLLQMVSCDHC